MLKKAKTSETQRLIKKLRFLRKKLEDAAEGDEGKMKGTKQEVADLEQQLDILKVSNHTFVFFGGRCRVLTSI